MKARFRKLARLGWHKVRVPRSAATQWAGDMYLDVSDDGAHYRHLREWCNKTFAKDSWEGRRLQNNWWRDTSSEVIIEEFVFKNEKDKTLFLLKWGS